MNNKGMSHFGLMTHDIDETIAFYTEVLGFEPIAYYVREIGEGHLRQVFFDLGNGQSLEFAQSHNVPGIKDEFDAGINEGLGIDPAIGIGFIHFAFRVDSMEELNAKQARLEKNGVKAIGPLDLDWMQSIYFADPNGVQLEYAYINRPVPGEEYMSPIQSDTWQRLRGVQA